MSARSVTRGRASMDTGDTATRTDASADVQKSLALGYLAMLPLFIAYELAQPHIDARNTAEVFLCLPWAGLAPHVESVRRGVLALIAVIALWRAFDDTLGLAPRLLRIVLEGIVASALFGPLLLLALAALGAEPPRAALLVEPAWSQARLSLAGLLCGGAAYEELVFRVGLVGLCFLFTKRLVALFGADARVGRAVSEGLAVVAAGLMFAASHLELFTEVFGAGGEEFDRHVFTWRALAGMLLSALFRWRGPGVAAWTHAFFNLAVMIGAGPGAFL